MKPVFDYIKGKIGKILRGIIIYFYPEAASWFQGDSDQKAGALSIGDDSEGSDGEKEAGEDKGLLALPPVMKSLQDKVKAKFDVGNDAEGGDENGSDGGNKDDAKEDEDEGAEEEKPEGENKDSSVFEVDDLLIFADFFNREQLYFEDLTKARFLMEPKILKFDNFFNAENERYLTQILETLSQNDLCQEISLRCFNLRLAKSQTKAYLLKLACETKSLISLCLGDSEVPLDFLSRLGDGLHNNRKILAVLDLRDALQSEEQYQLEYASRMFQAIDLSDLREKQASRRREEA